MSLSGVDENRIQNGPILQRRNQQPRNRSGGIRTKKTVSRGWEQSPAATKSAGQEKESQDHSNYDNGHPQTHPASKDGLQKQEVRKYEAIGTGDTELYIFARMRAAVIISIRVFLFRRAGKAN